MRLRSILLLSAVLTGLTACANLPAPPRAEELFADARFAAPSEPIAASDVFALSDAMRHALTHEMATQLRRSGPQRGLIDALQHRGQLRLEYDAAMTRNAAQAFDAKRGNCLSLVIMTAAFAKELGLTVRYQTVHDEQTWERVAGIHFSSGHVNLSLGTRFDGTLRGGDRHQALTIDFLPASEITGQRVSEISEATVVAMYMNNRAAEALALGRIDDAYWWAREAIRQQPTHLNAYNTLSVVYLRHGSLELAQRVLEQVLEREPENTLALSNLEYTFSRSGRPEQARSIAARLAAIEPYPPFHFFDRGIAAMLAGDYRRAKSLFEKEIARKSDYHEFHFWLGVAHAYLGELPQARQQITLAIETSTQGKDRDLYASKLERLRPRQIH
jgi:tetratricopeptide (TPR) repeat protein